jgi:hypothetical protein
MIYEFVDTETGERVELEYPAKAAPGLDSIVHRDGRTLRRVLSMPAIGVLGAKPFKPHAANSLDPWLPSAPRHDDQGRPVFLNRSERDEAIKRENARREKVGDTKRIEIRE